MKNMKIMVLTLTMALFLLSSNLFSEDKDKVQERMDALENLFETEQKEDTELKKSQKEMLKDLEKLMKAASDNMQLISPMLKSRKTGDKVQGVQESTLDKLTGMIKLIKEMEKKNSPSSPPSKKNKPKIIRKKIQPEKKETKSQSKEGDKSAKSDEMSEGTLSDGELKMLRELKRGKNAFGNLPKKERDIQNSYEGSKMNSKYGKHIRLYFGLNR